MQSILRTVISVFLMFTSSSVVVHANETDNRNTTRTVVVPLAAGGAGDKLGRMLAQRLAEETGRNYIVENKPGAGGNIAAAYVAKSRNNGHTLLMTTGGMLTLNPHIYKSITFDPLEDFTFIAKWVDSPNILFVSNETPVKNFDEFMPWARERSGKLNFGSAGIGSSQHLAAELFKTRTGIDFVHVPYKGGTPAVHDLAAGLLDFTFSTIAGIRMMEAGKLRPLAVTSRQRLSTLPEIPTLEETGLPEFEANAWYGVVGPAGMDAAEVALIEHVVKGLSEDEKISKELEAEALIVDYRNHVEFRQYSVLEYNNWKTVIDGANFTNE